MPLGVDEAFCLLRDGLGLGLGLGSGLGLGLGSGLGLGLGLWLGLGIDQLYLWDGEAELVDQRSLRAQPGHSVRQALLDLRLKAVR